MSSMHVQFVRSELSSLTFNLHSSTVGLSVTVIAMDTELGEVDV